MAKLNNTVSRVLATAAKEIGTLEGRDKNGNWNNRVKYTTWYANHPKIKDSAFLTSAWCAIFVSWVADQVGILGDIIPMHAWTPSGLAWFQKRGLVSKGAKPGDIFYKYYPAQGRVAHVGIVERVEGGYIYTIEGNTNTTGSSQGNGVYRLRRKIDSNLYFCHPRYNEAKTGTTGGAAPKPPKVVATTVQYFKHIDLKLYRVSLTGLKAAALQDRVSKDSTTNWGAVMPLQVALYRLGFLTASGVTGKYQEATYTAVSSAQKAMLKGQKYSAADVDGVIGEMSLNWIAKQTGFTPTK